MKAGRAMLVAAGLRTESWWQGHWSSCKPNCGRCV